MNIIVGHSNMDLDCFGSMVLARHLYPGYSLIKSRFIHPVAKNVYSLYKSQLNLQPVGELKNKKIDHMVIVDTRSYKRVQEYFNLLAEPPRKIEIYDHHPSDSDDIKNAKIHSAQFGSNTTLLCQRLIKRDIRIGADDATIALAGIYADTGNFTHQNVSPFDFEASSFLMSQGASIEIAMKLLETLKEKYQITLFHEMLNRLTYKDINGHMIILAYMEIDEQQSGLAAVVEKVYEIENPDALFAVFSCKKEKDVLIISRGKNSAINLNEILKAFGGGGHKNASSAFIKDKSGILVFAELEEHLYKILLPALKAADIMSCEVHSISAEKSLLDASMLMEQTDNTGLPVTGKLGELAGIITLRDIMKGRRASQMDAPVKSYMNTQIVFAEKYTSMRELEELFYHNNIGLIPVLEKNRLAGIVTRSGYLEYIKNSHSD